MTDIRQLLHDITTPPPAPDPRAAVYRRISQSRRRRAVLAVAGSAVAVAGIAIAATGLTPGHDRAQPAQDVPLTASVTRDGLRLDVKLSTGSPAVGERVTGTLTVTNTGPQTVKILSGGCGDYPYLALDYRPTVDFQPSSPPPTEGAELFRSYLLGPRSPHRNGFFAPVADRYLVSRGSLNCRGVNLPRDLAPGASSSRDVTWVAQSLGGTAVDSQLPAEANISYLLPPRPDGRTPDGDPSSRGSTTPSARDLTLDFTIRLHGGDPQRKSVTEVVNAATTDPRFVSALKDQPPVHWQIGWLLAVDKKDGHTFGPLDTDHNYGPVPIWYVALITQGGPNAVRVTARVDGRTGDVLDVSTKPDP